MIRRHLSRVLIVVNALSLLLLFFMWVQHDGVLRNTRWAPPAPYTTDFAALLPALPAVAPADTSQFVAMLDRPLFSPTRRPPPAPPPLPAAQAEAPSDLLSTATISGLYAGSGAGGVIINLGGKHRRVQLNQAVEGWTLQSIEGRSVTFMRGGESRALQLPRGALAAPAGPAQTGRARSTVAPMAARPEPPAATPSSSSNTQAGEGAAPAKPRAVFGGARR